MAVERKCGPYTLGATLTLVPGTVIAVAEQLEKLAGAYFHQDFGLDFSTADAVVVAFAEGEGRTSVRQLIEELTEVIDGPLDESEIRHLWTRVWFGSYEPSTAGDTYRKWFTHLIRTLTAWLE